MSVQEQIKRITAPDIRARKGGDPIVCLTSYHAHTARLVDKYCDIILVGDSLGMVMHGMETTLGVSLEFPFQHILKLIERVVNPLGPFSNDRFAGRAPQHRVTWLVECIVFYLPKKTRKHGHDL